MALRPRDGEGRRREVKFVITLGDAVDLACVVLVLIGLAIGIAIKWARESNRKKGDAK